MYVQPLASEMLDPSS